jgi:hypothetical protein
LSAPKVKTLRDFNLKVGLLMKQSVPPRLAPYLKELSKAVVAAYAAANEKDERTPTITTPKIIFPSIHLYMRPFH